MMKEAERLEYNARIEAIRKDQFPMLHDNIYLDHAAAPLYPKSLVDTFAAEMTANLFGNPHSASASSQKTTCRIENIRHRVLEFFSADPAEFDIVFVANTTAGIKLVSDAFRAFPDGFDYRYHQACHTSLVGVREEARNSLCFNSQDIGHWTRGDELGDDGFSPSRPTLVAYPAQSNMDGRRFPLAWCQELYKAQENHGSRVYTLLDAAAFASTSPLDLSDASSAPDFVVLSFYKIFGFPILGGLLVKREAASVFQNRRYFGGGTVDMVVCLKEKWHAQKSQSLHEAVEDGTLPIHNIIALDSAFHIHRKLYGSMADIAFHTAFLLDSLHTRLKDIRHGNGEPVCIMYSPSSESHENNGPILAFNLRNDLGAWISLAEFEKLATLKGFHVRTGGLCNPGGVAAALGLEPWEMKENFSAGFRCGNENDVMNGKPTGVIRVSLGAMSSLSDVNKFIAFIEEFYQEKHRCEPTFNQSALVEGVSQFSIDSIMVYPIKSCSGFCVPRNVAWGVRPEGLAWDREWCLVHQGTGRALSQKQYPRMVLIKPTIDFSTGQLNVAYHQTLPGFPNNRISVPLSANPNLFKFKDTAMTSRVCGEEVSIKIYHSKEVNSFFSAVLGVPCALARFPPGGLGKSMRHSKAHLQSHQLKTGSTMSTRRQLAGVHTPPDSDSESERQRILLSNESPILAINLSSLHALNKSIVEKGGSPVSPEAFRANIVIRSSSESKTLAYSEDHWSKIKIGTHNFQMLGACRRCHMVCINQNTATRSEEPFITLAKTRRFNGRVFFGVHMCHLPALPRDTKEAQYPTITAGDEVVVDVT
ncbi:MOSC N-terminal beta barrel domain-containing protein [Xylariaceae sp. FL0255]|nr:MOSC N-terminal beta barrel domain-containing protein [Xylariaceae sp. FL0255]